MFGFFPEWKWRSYVLADGFMHRSDPKRFLFAKHCDVLCHAQASRVLARIFQEDPETCSALRAVYHIPRYVRDLDTLQALVNLLGISLAPFDAGENRVARLVVLERRVPKVQPPVLVETKRRELPRLSEKSSWVSIECLDDRAPPRPVANVTIEVVTASAEVRTVHTNADGGAYIGNIPAGRVSIRVLGMDGRSWRPLEGDAATPCGTDRRFTWHEVQRDECLSSIAHRYGFKDWRVIWAFGSNEPLRKKRKSPHVLHPGDLLAIPTVQLFEIARSTEQIHRIEVTPPHFELALRLSDHHGRPFRSQAYELRLTRDPGEAPSAKGTTDGEGMLRERVPASAEQIYVSLPALQLTWPVVVSTVPGLPERAAEAFDEQQRPREEAVRALQLRLTALGVATGPVDGAWNASTQLALLKLRQGRGRAGTDPLQDADLQDLARFGV